MVGFESRETVEGEMEFPQIAGWPNQGVGRVNLDGSKGACTPCHSRHTFSIEMARKPYTCKECHVGPDVPAFKVYAASKHGNIFSSLGGQWNFHNVPWTVGRDFTAPTCAVCHVSLLVDGDGGVIARRTHRMNDRLSWRIFGLIYAHAHPKSPDTTIIRNRNGLPLPTDLDGGAAQAYLIDPPEMRLRTHTMQAVCLGCHGDGWVRGHWQRYEHAITESNHMVRAATRIMQRAWKAGLATGRDGGGSLFDEAVEKRWSHTWLFYGNTVRFASAMAGGGDYGVFADGRFALSERIEELQDWLTFRLRTESSEAAGRQK